jgi:hypothetical protein
LNTEVLTLHLHQLIEIGGRLLGRWLLTPLTGRRLGRWLLAPLIGRRLGRWLLAPAALIGLLRVLSLLLGRLLRILPLLLGRLLGLCAAESILRIGDRGRCSEKSRRREHHQFIHLKASNCRPSI